jgi:SIR2-like domain
MPTRKRTITPKPRVPVSLQATMEVPDQLVNELKNRRLVAFVGAGISQKMGMPCWDDFLERLVKQFRYDRPTTFAKLFPSDWRDTPNASLTSLVKETIGAHEFYSACRNQLARYEFKEVPRFLSLLARLPFQFYVTTNFDKVMEYTYFQEWDRMLPVFNFPRMEDLSSVFRQHGPCLVKLHGDIDLPESLVVTDEDYDRLTTQGKAERFLRNLTTNYSILFIGYSFSDGYLRDILSRLHSEGESMPHYSITHDSLEQQSDLASLGVEPVPLTCGPDIDQTSDQFMAKLATLYWTGMEGSRQMDRGHGRQCQHLLDEQGAKLQATRTLSLKEFEYTYITAAKTKTPNQTYRLYGVTDDSLTPLTDEFHATALEMYPASALEPSATGVLVLWTEDPKQLEWENLLVQLGPKLKTKLTLKGTKIRLEDLDGDGRLEILVTSQIGKDEDKDRGITQVYRMEDHHLMPVTFESTRTMRPAADEMANAFLSYHKALPYGRMKEDELLNSIKSLIGQIESD